MATIEDLETKSVSEMSEEEALELLRRIRLSRRTTKARKRSPSKSKKPKKLNAEKFSAKEAKRLLEMLEE